ncbi:MAG TPA: hypothetical protein VH518_13485 [Tepidisphaeraceae bacterium]|jgi:hypothetical protein
MPALVILEAANASPQQQLAPEQWWALIGLGAMALIYFTIVRPMMRRKADPLEKSAPFSSLSQQRSTERQMQNLLVELSEMARQISAQLDTRAAKLELLIQQAEEKIAALKQAMGQTDSAPPPPLISSPLPALDEPPDPRHADVYALADEGRDVGQIASELGRPRGEVELILALRAK